MKSNPNGLSASFYDTSKTTAEITLDLYRTIAEASGSSLLIGCNTVSHLAAGLFEIQRTGTIPVESRGANALYGN